MIQNYLKIAFRTIVRHRGNAAINVTGLAVGIAACMLIYLFVNHELNFDTFNKNYKNIYRLVFDYKFPDKLDHLSVASPIAGITVKKNFPEVLNYTAVTPYGGKLLVKYRDKRFYEENTYIADSSFFNVFDYKLLQGNKDQVLREPNSLVIDQSTALKYFGKENPVGKMLEYDNNDGTFSPYKITGVFENIPSNSHLRFNSLVSYKTLELLFGAQGISNWHNAGSFVYIQLRPGTDPKIFEKKIEHLYDKYADQYKNIKASINMNLEPLTAIHLHSDRLFDSALKGNAANVYVFSAIAIFLLLIACINYINLATAQGKLRMKEIGVKKTLGAGRNRLLWQFITESGIVVLLALVFSQLLVLAFLPAFNYLASLQLSFFELYTAKNCLFLLVLGVCIVLLAGVYPAFYLTAFKPVSALRNASLRGEKGIGLRKTLVVTQFTISIVLISATLIVRNQVNYMLDHDPGFNKNNVVAIHFQDTLTAFNYPAIKNKLLQLKGVVKVSQTSCLPGDAPDRKITRVEAKTRGTINEIPLEPIWVDWDYFDLMQIRLKEGRLFERSHGLDPRESFVVNESATKHFGWDSSLGKKIIWGRNGRERNGQVIGVVKDIYTGSLKNQVDPILFICDENPARAYTPGYLLVRVDGADKERTIKSVCATWQDFDKAHPLDYKFVDNNISALYSGEQKTNSLFQYLSLLTIFIACLGLFGLISFSVSQRVKEIGIRKVLGAGVASITTLLTTDFLKLVLTAFLIALPTGWYVMHRWLESFAFRTDISWGVFLLSGSLAFLIATITISFQAIRAATANPIKNLRTE